MANSYDSYDDNSPQALLRVALAVALGDEILDSEEQRKLKQVYDEIREEMDDFDEDIDMEEDVESVSEEVVDELSVSDSPEDRLELYEDWAAAITDPDLQEIALISALRVAGAGHDYASAESVALAAFCQLWNMDLDELLEPFRR
jgi:hypothetical protein